jgi:hypothetical protein
MSPVAYTPDSDSVTETGRPHQCGWAKDAAGVWRCLQDHYAVGHRPDTSCGATWAPEKETPQ